MEQACGTGTGCTQMYGMRFMHSQLYRRKVYKDKPQERDTVSAEWPGKGGNGVHPILHAVRQVRYGMPESHQYQTFIVINKQNL